MGQAAFYAYAYAFNASLLLLAPKLFKGKGEGALATDFTPTNLAQQGSFVPLLIGRRRLGFTFGWAGFRGVYSPTVRVEGKGSKKKKQATGQIVYFEAGWHMICLGPAKALRRIYQDGKVIFDTLIERETTPSGSTFFTADGTGDSFAVYWGETDQPANALLGTGTGVPSAWPFLCYVYWSRKTLGPSPRWPQIEYDLEVEQGAGTLATTDLAARYDASDSGSITLVTGRVSAWDDVGGVNSYDLVQGTAGLRPLFLTAGSGIGDLAAVQFDGTTDAVTYVDPGLPGPFTESDGEVWAVVKIDSLPSAGNIGTIFAGYRRNVSTIYLFFCVTETGALEIRANNAAGAVRRIATPAGTVAAGGTYVLRFGSTGTAYFVQVNGVAASLSVVSGSNDGVWWGDVLAPGGNYIDGVTIGATGLSGVLADFLAETVGEVLVYESSLSQVDADNTLGYLANKWLVEDAFGFHAGWSQIVGSILFRPYPQGLGLDSTAFDLRSLNSVSAELEDESLEFSALARDGEEALAIVAGLMQDAGVMLYRHPATGLYTFATVRQATATAIPDGMVVDGAANAELVQQHGDPGASRLIFTFPDAARAYRETAIAIDADGLADRLSHHRARRVPLMSVTDEDVAKIVTERRSQEELGAAGMLTLRLNREARGALAPNSVIEVSTIDEVLRVVETRPEVDGNAVEVKAVPDAYGSEPSTFTTGSGGGSTSGGTAVAADEQATWLEIPEHVLDPGDPITIAPLRVRAHDQIAYANVHLSLDGTTYQLVAQDFAIHAGGELDEAIEADDPFTIETGPEVTLAGVPDVDEISDFSADEPSWRMGRQLVVIDDEIFFLRELVAVSGNTYRLDGLIRARYDTSRAAHSIGAKVYIFPLDELSAVTDPMIFPGVDLYVKSQPVASTELALGSVAAVDKTLYGKGQKPPKPCGVRVTAPALGVAAYHAGEGVTFRWASRVAHPVVSGAGMFPANSVVGEVVGETDFKIEVYDAGDVLVRTEFRSTGTWTYTYAALISDLGTETDFSIKVYEVRGGFASTPAELAVEFLA